MRTLLWLQNDFRLHDNPALLEAAKSDHLLIMTCWPNPKPWCNLKGIGAQRHRFLAETLAVFQKNLVELGQGLHITGQSAATAIPELVAEHKIDRIVTTAPRAYEERILLEHVQKAVDINVNLIRNNTLLDEQQLPFDLKDIPKHFTPFRKKVESIEIEAPLAKPLRLPPMIKGVSYKREAPEYTARPHPTLPLRGGEQEALRRVKNWIFDRRAIVTYKETRNALDGLDNFSALAPWLATGALSARFVASEVARFEREITSNESTYWVIFELLWREFFHWRAIVDDNLLFLPYGVARKKQLRTFDPRQFTRWCQGETDFPLVNALMHQLVKSGFMSNRGRQIAASCLIHDLGVDWRYGAAFFEKHLMDYDVGSNYGNWQYIAGVGSDPRGGRHFNIEKQTEQYDPDGRFVKQWDGYRPKQPEYVTDASDWPIG